MKVRAGPHFAFAPSNLTFACNKENEIEAYLMISHFRQVHLEATIF